MACFNWALAEHSMLHYQAFSDFDDFLLVYTSFVGSNGSLSHRTAGPEPELSLETTTVCVQCMSNLVGAWEVAIF
ncbi:hypothetical protein CsSME_00038103 [Camellia sinensis var. sinensis]